MPSSFDPGNIGPMQSSNQGASDITSETSTTEKLIFAQPGGVQINNRLPPMKPVKRSPFQRLNNRKTWYIVCAVAALCVVLGFIFNGPLSLARNAQPGTSNQPGKPGQPGNTGNQAITPGAYDSTNSRLFSSTSPWNTPIGTNVQLDPNSSGMVNQLSDCCHVPTLFRYGMPIYTSTASDPTYYVKDDDDTFESYQPIHIPDTAAPSPGSDKWLFIYDKTKNLIFEMWQAQKSGDAWTANTGNVYSPTGDGVLQVDGSLQSGNGASYFGGVVTKADIQRGYINHALSMVSQYTANTWRYPMNASDGQGTNPNDLPMGARLQLDPSIDCNTLSNASTGEKMVCQALQTYGGYIRDTGGVALSIYFEGEDLSDPNRNPPDGSPGNPGRPGGIFDKVSLQDGKDLSDIPWDQLRVLKSWNSFTALSTTSSPALTAQTTLPGTQSTPANTTLDEKRFALQ